MMTDITQLDEIDEDYIVSALSDIQGGSDTLGDDISIEDVFEEEPMSSDEPLDTSVEESVVEKEENDTIKMDLNSSEANNIMELLKQLIDGKTLEISIKVKD